MATSTVRPRAASGDGVQIGEGKFIAKLTSTRAVQTKNGASGIGLNFEARGDAGKIEETLWDSDRAAARMALFAKRLGASFDDDDEEAEIDWDDFVGNEYVIEVEHQEYQGRNQARITYAGIWPLNHEDVAVWVGKQKGGKPSNGKPAKSAASVDVDDV